MPTSPTRQGGASVKGPRWLTFKPPGDRCEGAGHRFAGDPQAACSCER